MFLSLAVIPIAYQLVHDVVIAPRGSRFAPFRAELHGRDRRCTLGAIRSQSNHVQASTAMRQTPNQVARIMVIMECRGNGEND